MKKNIAIIMGGYSSEVEISLKSGNVVYNSLDLDKYNAYRVLILKEKWIHLDENDVEHPINMADFTTNVNGYKVKFDAVFNAIHGHPGEDGVILSYLELLGIPHTSAPSYQMALTFNKRDCLSVVKAYGIKTANSYYLNEGDAINENEIVEKVELPCFVKANRAGSSFGISKVYKIEHLRDAIELAFKEDDEIIIESFLDGTEVSVGVITYNNEIKVLPITEITTDNDFFDYEAKYQGKSEEITPARVSKKDEQRIKEVAKKVYTILRMSGFSRSEYILIDGEPHMLEMNTVPGLTTQSLLPQQANMAGISLTELFGNAVESSLDSSRGEK